MPLFASDQDALSICCGIEEQRGGRGIGLQRGQHLKACGVAVTGSDVTCEGKQDNPDLQCDPPIAAGQFGPPPFSLSRTNEHQNVAVPLACSLVPSPGSPSCIDSHSTHSPARSAGAVRRSG